MSPRLRDLQAAAGARFETRDGVEAAVSYGDDAAEYRAVREGVGLADMTHLGALEVTGRDRAAFLNAMLSNDIKRLAPGEGCRAALLDVHGKIQVIVTVLALEERLLVLTPPGRAASTFEALDRYLFSEKAFFKDVSEEVAALLLAGPGTAEMVRSLTGATLPETAWGSVPVAVDGAAVRLARGASDLGAPDAWLIAGPGEVERVWRAATAGGARPVGLTALEPLRIEGGTPRLGTDIDDGVLLPEIPFADLVSYTKGCYLGQEVVVRIRDRGHVNRHLRGLRVEGTGVPEAGAPVLAGEAEVGRVTSAAWSPGFGQPVALAFVRRPHAEPGTALAVRAAAGTVSATVSVLLFPR